MSLLHSCSQWWNSLTCIGVYLIYSITSSIFFVNISETIEECSQKFSVWLQHFLIKIRLVVISVSNQLRMHIGDRSLTNRIFAMFLYLYRRDLEGTEPSFPLHLIVGHDVKCRNKSNASCLQCTTLVCCFIFTMKKYIWWFYIYW